MSTTAAETPAAHFSGAIPAPTKMLKLLFIVENDVPHAAAGGFYAIYKFAEFLSQRGHSIAIYGVHDMNWVDEISEVLLFGSRAKGNYKIGSDVDLAIKGDRVTPTTVLELSDCLNEEKPLPYFFDVIQYETIDELRLVEHIDRVGIVIFGQTALIPTGLGINAQNPDLR